MNEQIPIPLSGTALRDIGIAQAVDHAEAEAPGWSVRAMDMLRRYVDEVGGAFQAEDVREWARMQGLDDPPSTRAWGGVIVRARNLGLIRFVKYENVQNRQAHATPASVWEGKI